MRLKGWGIKQAKRLGGGGYMSTSGRKPSNPSGKMTGYRLRWVPWTCDGRKKEGKRGKHSVMGEGGLEQVKSDNWGGVLQGHASIRGLYESLAF